MRSMRHVLTGVAIVAAFYLGWSIRGDRDVASAQTRAPIMMTRIYTGADGLSHAEEVPMKFANGGATEMMKATGVEFSRRPPGPASDWHVGPRRQFVITLSGHAELHDCAEVCIVVGEELVEALGAEREAEWLAVAACGKAGRCGRA